MTGDLIYLDASAAVKLAAEEHGSMLLRDRISGSRLVTSDISRIEISRVLRRLGVAAHATNAVMGAIATVRIDDELIGAASTLDPPELRSLDAIHLATAMRFSRDLDSFITYDRQLGRAAAAAGLRVEAPR